jgi:formylglycine-generating enzyme required for sulfatase activity
MAAVIAALCLSMAACSGESEPRPVGHAAGMVLIPAGAFQMGANGPDSPADEQPVHSVHVASFYIDRCEVTNAEYRRFVIETGHAPPRADEPWAEPYNWTGSDYPAGTDEHPVVLVSWHDAAAYAAWVGKRLPTEAEWEKAARSGMTGQEFPYGDRLELNQANYYKSYLRAKKLRPVGSYEPSAQGLYDMAGNVWEWCQDWYRADYYRRGTASDPQGPPNGTYKVIRGGSWMNDEPFLKCARRGKNSPDQKSPSIGFRCVRSASQEDTRGGSED